MPVPLHKIPSKHAPYCSLAMPAIRQYGKVSVAPSTHQLRHIPRPAGSAHMFFSQWDQGGFDASAFAQDPLQACPILQPRDACNQAVWESSVAPSTHQLRHIPRPAGSAHMFFPSGTKGALMPVPLHKIPSKHAPYCSLAMPAIRQYGKVPWPPPHISSGISQGQLALRTCFLPVGPRGL